MTESDFVYSLNVEQRKAYHKRAVIRDELLAALNKLSVAADDSRAEAYAEDLEELAKAQEQARSAIAKAQEEAR